MHTVPPDATLGTIVFDEDGGSSMWPTDEHNARPSIPTDLGITPVCTVKVVNFISPFYNSSSAPPKSSPFTIWR